MGPFKLPFTNRQYSKEVVMREIKILFHQSILLIIMTYVAIKSDGIDVVIAEPAPDKVKSPERTLAKSSDVQSNLKFKLN